MPGKKFPLAVKAVMIDLDGTLLDTVADLASAADTLLEKLGRPLLGEAVVRTFVGKGIPHLVGRLLTATQTTAPDDALQEHALKVFLDCYEIVNGRHTTIYPGVREGLAALKKAGFPLACVTNKSGRFTRPLLEHMDLAPFFSVTVAGDTLPQRKPDPAPLMYACAQFGVKAHEMLMIGDSVNDAQAARAAGCPVFCVPYGYNEGGDVRTLDVDAIVETLFEATHLITKS
jgi:phosphoglycolate phosphatase